jgi:hypothetical protein
MKKQKITSEISYHTYYFLQTANGTIELSKLKYRLYKLYWSCRPFTTPDSMTYCLQIEKMPQEKRVPFHYLMYFIIRMKGFSHAIAKWALSERGIL